MRQEKEIPIFPGTATCMCRASPTVHRSMIWRYLIEGPWIVFVAYWAAGALKTRRTVSQESLASRYGILFLEILGFVLLFSDISGDRRSWSSRCPSDIRSCRCGRRTHLDRHRYRSVGPLEPGTVLERVSVTLKEDHELIRTGPYAYFRHPIYSGIDLAAVGGALAIDKWRCVAGVGLIVLGYWIKARKEESLLAAQFGKAFKEHCRHTGFLLPHFW